MQIVLGKEGKDIEIGGKRALDKINTEGTVRTWRQSLDGFDVEDGTDSSEDNGRRHGIETKGDDGFHGVGG